METIGMELATLLKVIGVDLILSGDNAIVIALAAKDVPADLRKSDLLGNIRCDCFKIINCGHYCVVIKNSIDFCYWGILLVRIAYKLLAGKEKEHKAGGSTVASAVRTIIIADAVMSLDNVLALAGVAHEFLPILLGILISIPIIIWGSQIILKAMEKLPIIVYAGAGLLAYTAGEMIVKDQKIDAFLHSFAPNLTKTIHVGLPIGLVIIVVGMGYFKRKNKKIEAS